MQSTILVSTSSIATPITCQSTCTRVIKTPSSLSLPTVEVPASEAPGPIVHVDLVAIEKAATRENSTRVKLEMLQLFLITERTQERLRVEEHPQFVKERRSVSLGLLDVLDDAIEVRGRSRCNICDSEEEMFSEVSEEGDLESPPRTSLGESPQVLEDVKMTVSEEEIDTGDRPLFTDPVLVEYIVVPCPMSQHFPRQEQVEFFQNVPNNVTRTSQLSTL